MADRIESNGSFYVSKGTFQYTGLPPGDIDQVVTFDYETKEVTSTDLSKLLRNNCVSQYESSPPSSRPRGGELQVGDFWTDKESKLLHIWDGDQWVLVKATARIITSEGPPTSLEPVEGDTYFDESTLRTYIYYSGSWVVTSPFNTSPVGTIIQNVSITPPLGYLACDGTPCPPQYTELVNLLITSNGNSLLPDIPGAFIKF